MPTDDVRREADGTQTGADFTADVTRGPGSPQEPGPGDTTIASAGTPARGPGPDPDATRAPLDEAALTIAADPAQVPTLQARPVPGRASAAPLPPGALIGDRYTVIKLLGRGGMGAVYQAFDGELGVAIALKTILPGYGSDEHTLRDQESRFKSELLLARQVTHKNVVRIHDLGVHAGLKYITMTYVDGETLDALVRRGGPLPVPQVVSLARQIADGLKAAHDVGIVHRDLKPENVMVRPDGQALIMDFGIAGSAAELARAGDIVGTLTYMAPEQAAGKAVDQRADIYAFGLILHDLLTGRARFTGYDKVVQELRARETAAPPPVTTFRAEVPAALEAIVTRATQPDPEQRFADVAAVQAALALLDDNGVPLPVEQPRPWWHAAAAALLPSAVVGGGVWWATPRAPAPPKDPVSLLIADFANRTGDPVFTGVVEQALSLGVEEASFVTAYPRRDALRIAASIKPGAPLDEETARLVALREGVGMVLTGALEPRDDGYRLSAHVLAGGGEQEARELYTFTVNADGRDAVLQAVGRLAGEVREALGDTEVPRGGPAANETFTAASLEAARAYAAAQELQWAGKVEEAIAQFKRTIALDPDMGRAYSGLAAQYANLGRTAEAEENYQQAMARIDRMTDREKFRTRGSYFLFARKPDLAAKEFTALVQAYPADSSGLTNLALASFYLRDMRQALDQGRRAAAIFPKNVLRRSNVALYAMYAGQFETAIQEADAVHELNPTQLKAFVAKALSLVGLGREAEAAAVYAELAATGPAGASFAAGGQADLAVYQGKLTEAARLLDAAVADSTATKNPAAVAARRVALAEVRLAQGDLTAAIREATLAVEASDVDVVRAGAGLVLAAAGAPAQANALAKLLADRLEADPQAYSRLIRAEVALQAQDPRMAVEQARESQKLADTWLGRVLLGRAYLGLGAFTEAYAEFEAAINRKGEATAVYLDDVPTVRQFPPVLYYMGLAQEGLKSPAAQGSFSAYLDIVRDGDETVLSADARRRVSGR